LFCATKISFSRLYQAAGQAFGNLSFFWTSAIEAITKDRIALWMGLKRLTELFYFYSSG
jgi:hypothetical protein